MGHTLYPKVNLLIFLYAILSVTAVYGSKCSKIVNKNLKLPSEAGFATEITKDGEVLWNYTTGRSSSTIYDRFSHAPYGGSESLEKSGLKLLDKAEVLEVNSKAVLSLGEGASLFIHDLLKARESIDEPINNIIAIDTVYTNKGKFSYLHPSREIGDLSYSVKTIKARISSFLSNYPGNYLNKGIYGLSITDKNNNKIMFDEIISSNALSYVLDGSSRKDQYHIIENLIDHLKSGGYLRSTPSLNDGVVKTVIKDLIGQKVIKAIIIDKDHMIIKKL